MGFETSFMRLGRAVGVGGPGAHTGEAGGEAMAQIQWMETDDERSATRIVWWWLSVWRIPNSDLVAKRMRYPCLSPVHAHKARPWAQRSTLGFEISDPRRVQGALNHVPGGRSGTRWDQGLRTQRKGTVLRRHRTFPSRRYERLPTVRPVRLCRSRLCCSIASYMH
jgi:hypothetical protein